MLFLLNYLLFCNIYKLFCKFVVLMLKLPKIGKSMTDLDLPALKDVLDILAKIII